MPAGTVRALAIHGPLRELSTRKLLGNEQRCVEASARARASRGYRHQCDSEAFRAGSFTAAAAVSSAWRSPAILPR